jgi:hypothetical protein
MESEDDRLIRREQRIELVVRETMWRSPQQAITTSGSAPRSLLAHSQIPIPAAQCLIAWSIVKNCGAGCLPATTTLT